MNLHVERRRKRQRFSADRNVKDKTVAGWLNDEKGYEATHFFDLVTMRMIVSDEKNTQWMSILIKEEQMQKWTDRGRTWCILQASRNRNQPVCLSIKVFLLWCVVIWPCAGYQFPDIHLCSCLMNQTLTASTNRTDVIKNKLTNSGGTQPVVESESQIVTDWCFGLGYKLCSYFFCVTGSVLKGLRMKVMITCLKHNRCLCEAMSRSLSFYFST